MFQWFQWFESMILVAVSARVLKLPTFASWCHLSNLSDLSAHGRTPSVGSSLMWPSTTRMPAAARGKSLCLGVDVIDAEICLVDLSLKFLSLGTWWHLCPAQVGKSDVPETLTMAWPQELPRSLDFGIFWVMLKESKVFQGHVCQSLTY